MQQNFAAALKLVLGVEGGYSDDPQDAGGATDHGITQKVFNGWLRSHGDAARDVRTITPDEVAAIYHDEYWSAVKGDELPAGVDIAVFDFAVNSGVARAAIYLQEIVGVAPDGRIGPLTLAAVAKDRPVFLITKLCAMRIGFLKRLSGWGHDGHGWTNRVNAVEQAAMNMVPDT